jgi:uroporphyrinogen III methyltransferase/synthase
LAVLQSADVIVHDRLIPRELLSQAKAGAELIDVGKSPGRHRVPQEQIQSLLVEHAARGRCVVRLKGGDPFVFGSGFEELQACQEAGIDCVVIPGVTSAIAGPAAAGIPVTYRGASRSFAVVTAESSGDDSSGGLDYEALARIDTLVVLMGRGNLRHITEGLIRAGRDPHAAVACIERATTADQRIERGTLATIADVVERAGLANPMITVVGDVARLGDKNAATGPARVLAGRRVVITRPRSAPGELESLLLAAGAAPILMPLIRIEYENIQSDFDESLARIRQYDWVIFSSLHGVRAFGQGLEQRGKDGRFLGNCRIAAVGRMTADELRRMGLLADVVPDRRAGAALVQAMAEAGPLAGKRVLFPRGDLGGAEVVEGLRGLGAQVDDPIVYRTVAQDPPPAVLDDVGRGVDAILFFSPSAVRRFSDLGVDRGDAAVGCIGPTTAQEAGACGIKVDFVSEVHSGAGLVDALTDHFSCVGAHSR